MYLMLKNKKDQGVQFIRSLFLDESGQSTTEYILILSIVVMVALKFKRSFTSSLTGMIQTVDGQINSGISDQGN